MGDEMMPRYFINKEAIKDLIHKNYLMISPGILNKMDSQVKETLSLMMKNVMKEKRKIIRADDFKVLMPHVQMTFGESNNQQKSEPIPEDHTKEVYQTY
jgi:hypothetical protein